MLPARWISALFFLNAAPCIALAGSFARRLWRVSVCWLGWNRCLSNITWGFYLIQSLCSFDVRCQRELHCMFYYVSCLFLAAADWLRNFSCLVNVVQESHGELWGKTGDEIRFMGKFKVFPLTFSLRMLYVARSGGASGLQVTYDVTLPRNVLYGIRGELFIIDRITKCYLN